MVATINMLVKEKPKCEEKIRCSCMDVETGTLVFAIVNCIFTGLICITCTVFMLNNLFVEYIDSHDTSTVINILLAVIMIRFLLAFSFGVVLAKGVLDRNSSYVKIYFVYGVVVTVLSWSGALAVLLYWSINYEADVPTYACAGSFAALFLYSLILMMVRVTYKKFKAESQYEQQMKIENRY